MLLSPATLLAVILLGSPTTEEDRLSAARIAFAAEDFATAVRGFEALAHDFPATAKYHYYAGLARENAGQDTHAFIHMQLFLKSSAGTPEERSIAEKRVAAISRRTTRTRIQLPANDLPAVLHITYQGPKPQTTRPPISAPLSVFPLVDVRPEILLEPGTWELKVTPALLGDQLIEPMVITIAAGTPVEAIRLKTTAAPQVPVVIDLKQPTAIHRKITVELRREGSTAAPIILTTSDPTLHTTLFRGTWTYKAYARGVRPDEGKIIVTGATRRTIELKPVVDPNERRRRLRLGLSLGGLGFATGAAGGALIAYGDRILTTTAPPNPALVFADTGMGLVGATSGVWIAAASSSMQSERGWFAEMLTGIIIASTGGILYAARNLEFDDNTSPYPKTLDERRPDMLASAFLTGMGVGLTTGALAGYLSVRNSRSNRQRASLHVNPHPRFPSLGLHLAF